MDISLEGKTAVIGGSTDGIGKAIAMKMAQQGARVVLLARNEEKLKAVSEELPTPAQQTHHFLVADFQNPDQVKKAIDGFVQDSPVHVLVNNTGGPPAGPVEDADAKDFEDAFRMHLICNQVLAQATIPGMREEEYGRIINIISTSVKQPIAGLGVSNTVRGAVANWSKTLANEVGKAGITVNNILPGYTETKRLSGIIKKKAQKQGVSENEVIKQMQGKIPLARFADPSELANVAAFLASPAAGYVSGINVPVDGGRLKCL